MGEPGRLRTVATGFLHAVLPRVASPLSCDKNFVYAPLAIISSQLSDSVWQVTGITDTKGGYGGGTANVVNVSNLMDTPLTTTGRGKYLFSAGFTGSVFAISSNNIALGFLNNSAAVIQGQTLQEDGAAADPTQKFLYPVIITNTYVVPG